MEPIEIYREALSQLQLAPPEKAWFATALADYRRHPDDGRLREICGRFLHQTHAEAEEFCRHQAGVDLLDAVQEANAALVESVASYRGSALAGFQTHVHQMVQAHLFQSFPPT